jgi:hypothetical protein
MILLPITFAWNLLISLFDLLFMCFTEFKYWIIIAGLKTEANKDEIEKKRKEASGNVSVIQFGFAYIIGILILLYLALSGWIDWWTAGFTLLSFGILHYSGNEDIWYFIYNFFLNVIPEWWWDERKDKIYAIGNHRLPKECPWLYEDKIVFGLTIRPYMLRLICGKNISFVRLAISSLIGWIVILAIYFQVWSYVF